MHFEYDKNKSQTNKEKHGIDFIDAQKLWEDAHGIVVPANIVGEEIRYALISKLNNKCYVAVFTLRDEAYRLISVRRCRKNEEKNYEDNYSQRI